MDGNGLLVRACWGRRGGKLKQNLTGFGDQRDWGIKLSTSAHSQPAPPTTFVKDVESFPRG